MFNWNKYLSKVSIERQNPYLDLLIDLKFLFYHLKIMHTEQDTGCFFPKVEVPD